MVAPSHTRPPHSAKGTPSVGPTLFCTCALSPPQIRLNSASTPTPSPIRRVGHRDGMQRSSEWDGRGKEGEIERGKKSFEEMQERGKKENKEEWEREGSARRGRKREGGQETRDALRMMPSIVAKPKGKRAGKREGTHKSEYKRGGDAYVRSGGGEELDEGAGAEFGFVGKELDNRDAGGGVEATGCTMNKDGTGKKWHVPRAAPPGKEDRRRDEHLRRVSTNERDEEALLRKTRLLSAFTKCGPHYKGVKGGQVVEKTAYMRRISIWISTQSAEIYQHEKKKKDLRVDVGQRPILRVVDGKRPKRGVKATVEELERRTYLPGREFRRETGGMGGMRRDCVVEDKERGL
ncbi:hypothetical protein B0H11DRAFT_1917253 [Mycena galericulata]|nr:hypothetical protein B0H11DRAFT_1917253 [Mycena galericulata]